MSFSNTPTLWCDHDDCLQWEYGLGDQGVRSVRRQLKRQGWVYRAGLDLCPEHSGLWDHLDGHWMTNTDGERRFYIDGREVHASEVMTP